jgi:hypothetical protein
MKRSEDGFVRKSYFGGATDIYKAYGRKLYYYDVNSLYPHVMKKPMPLNLIKKYNKVECDNLNINNFFGFLEVEVITPSNILKPILPMKYKGKTIFPTGS